jgi:hypothetical protein
MFIAYMLRSTSARPSAFCPALPLITNNQHDGVYARLMSSISIVLRE